MSQKKANSYTAEFKEAAVKLAVESELYLAVAITSGVSSPSANASSRMRR